MLGVRSWSGGGGDRTKRKGNSIRIWIQFPFNENHIKISTSIIKKLITHL